MLRAVSELLMKFEDFGLSEPILRAVKAGGYEVTTPIQAKAIPYVLEGRDLIGWPGKWY
ncbi:MAG: DEAD/DEAH box helicase [Pirellulaceae bacterium]